MRPFEHVTLDGAGNDVAPAATGLRKPLDALAARWREEAETLRAYGHQHTAASCERHADEMEAARTALLMASVTLEEAAELGGYSYSHLQTLVAEDKIPNVGSKGAPRIRRGNVPVRPGHGRRPVPASKGDLLDSSIRLLREGGR